MHSVQPRSQRLLDRGDVHAGEVIKDPGAVGALDDLAVTLAIDDVLAGHLHVATATDAALDIDDDLVALAFEKALVASEQDGIDGGGGGGAGILGVGELLPQPRFGPGQLLELDGAVGFGFAEDLGGSGNLAFGGFDLLHQDDLLVVEAADDALTRLDFVAERLVFLVFAGQPLLGAVLGDLLLFGIDLEFKLLAVALELVAVVLGLVEIDDGIGLAGLDEAALRIDVRNLDTEADKAAVAVLEDEELLDGFQHGAKVTFF